MMQRSSIWANSGLRCAATVLALAARMAWADGTVSTTELLEKLAPTNPALVQTLRDGFDLGADATGETIGRAVNAKLSGTRIGPYRIHGKSKQSASPVPLVIVLHTEITFYDAQKRKTQKVALASSVQEKLTSIEIETAPK